MRAALLIMMAFGFLSLAACAPTTGADQVAEAELTGAWRHWQPGQPGQPGELGQPDGGATASSGPAELAAVSPGPKAVILALHGFNDYSNAFQDVAAYLSERNIAVHAYDQKSFGANLDRGRWPGTEALTTDLKNAVQRLRLIYGDETPLYVLGESMGGAVSIVAAADDEPLDVDGLILSAPAVWGGPHMNPFYRVALWFASTLAPGWTLSPSGLEIRPSDNIDMLRAFSADPLVIKVTRTDAIAGLVALMDEALAAAPKLDLDILLLIGEKDEIVPLGAIDDFEEKLERGETTAIRYPEGYHMLMRDLQRANVFADIERWIDRKSPTDDKGKSRASSRPKTATEG